MVCKGICIRYKATKPVSGGRYENGQHRCQICEIFVSWEGLWCPCCGYRMRGKPRNKEYKEKYRDATGTNKVVKDKPKKTRKPRKPKVKEDL